MFKHFGLKWGFTLKSMWQRKIQSRIIYNFRFHYHFLKITGSLVMNKDITKSQSGEFSAVRHIFIASPDSVGCFHQFHLGAIEIRSAQELQQMVMYLKSEHLGPGVDPRGIGWIWMCRLWPWIYDF